MTEQLQPAAEEMITITKERYDDLIEQSDWLSALSDAGVDNWEGYSYAQELYQEQHGSEEE